MAKKSKAKKAIIGLLSVGVIAGGTAGAIYIVREYKVSNDAPVVDDVNSPNSNSNANDSDFNDNINNNIDNSTNNGSSEIDDNSDSNNNSGEIENNSGATEQPNPGEEIQAPVEKTDEEYKVEFENKIKELALGALERNYEWAEYSDILINKINAANGKVYLTADKKMTTTVKLFSELDLGVTLEGTVKENYEKVNSLELEDVILTEQQTILKDAVEDAQFKSLCLAWLDYR